MLPSSVCGLTKLSQSWNRNGHESYCKLEDTVDSLRDKVEQLRSKKRRIETKLRLEESAYMKPTHKVTEWLYKVDSIEAEVDRAIIEAKRELEERQTAGCCPWNHRSTRKAGLSFLEKLEAVEELLSVDDFDAVVQRTPHHHVDVIPVEATVDFHSNMDGVWRCLEDERSRIIGIFGMAGVGKTTLLKKIKDDLEKGRLGTPAVIWLSASGKTQEDIAKKLTVFLKKRKNESKRESNSSRKAILLIDDLWGRLDLSKIGSGYKVVFTTRSEAVCDGMAADAKLKLNCLSDDEARKLFGMNAGDDKLNSFPRAQHLCQGLPLALVAVGRAMARMRNPSLDELPGMDNVFRILQPSYDNLDDDAVRRLFLYCSILPGKIPKDELIRLWVGEGFVDFSDKRRGEYFVKKLEQACLLQSDEINDSVGMHSVIRAFGLSLCREHFFVSEGKPENVNEAVRISMDGEIDIATLQRSCPQLQTLFIRKNNLITLPVDFFKSMSSLKVLNLSNNGKLAELPSSIDILKNLHYLNLSWTSITELPVEVGLLEELEVLLADYTENWRIIPKGVVPRIPALKIFSKLGRKIYDDTKFLEELDRAEALNEIGVSLFSNEAVKKLLDSRKLQNCIRSLTLTEIKRLKIPVSFLAKMVQLENLVIDDCTDLQFEMDGTRYHVLSIQGFWIQNCSEIDNLRWLMFAPRLKVLDLHSCESLVEVIGSDFEPKEIKEIDERLGIFSNLKRMHLEDLRSLERVCPQLLRFPALRNVLIIECPQLSVLPFDKNNVSIQRSGHLHLESQLPVDEGILTMGTRKEDDTESSSAEWSAQETVYVVTSRARQQ